MNLEKNIAKWVAETQYDQLPKQAINLMKLMTKTIVGTTVAGAGSEGCEAVVEQVREWGGAPQSTLLIYGGEKLPAHAAVLANSVMARALDICDGMTPGIHLGSSLVPVALAMAEATGGCSGEDFITALAVGCELAARLSAAAQYDGFDPTGIGTIFGAAAVAGRLLGLDAEKMHHALALAFNQAAGSFQSNIDGSLAVRFIQGFVSQNGVICAELAGKGVTGPNNYIQGSFGYYHLFCKGQRSDVLLLDELGLRWSMYEMGFKSAPSCGATITGTDLILQIVNENDFAAGDVDSIIVTVGPPIISLVGHQFEVGDTPTVNAQFNLRYCVANGLLHGCSRLEHFTPAAVKNPRIKELVACIDIQCRDDWMNQASMKVFCYNGNVYSAQVDGPSGFPPRALTAEQHQARFEDNISFAGKPLANRQLEYLVAEIAALEAMSNVVNLVPKMISA